MREIKFRGRRITDGTWTYGDLIHSFDLVYVGDEYQFLKENIVVTASIGQYTELLDKNGKEIYEGDIVTGLDSIPSMIKAKGGAIQIAKLDNCLRFVLFINEETDKPEVIIEQNDGTDALNCTRWINTEYAYEMGCIAKHFFAQWAKRYDPDTDPDTRRRVQEAKEGAISERL